jgi:HD-like signal output (HDOD) protein
MSHALADLLEEIKSVEPLPQVASRVMQIASRDDIVPHDLVDVIQTDTGITAKVLKLCNSALYGFKREIASLPEAGNLLGVSTLVNLVLTSCAGRYFRDYGYADPDGTLRLWERSISIAFATSAVAGRSHGRVDRDRAYTVGLLENLGHLVLTRFVPDNREALQRALSADVEPLVAERTVFGLDHAEIGARLAERWNLPPVLVDAIRWHHEPESSRADVLMASIAHLGEIASYRFGPAAGPDEVVFELQPSALRRTGLAPEGLARIETELVRELAKAKRILEIA